MRLLAALLLFGLVSCSTLSPSETFKVQSGMTTNNVREAIGKPEDEWTSDDGTVIYHYKMAIDGWGNTIPWFVTFQNGKVIKWGSPVSNEEIRAHQEQQQRAAAAMQNWANQMQQNNQAAPMQPMLRQTDCSPDGRGGMRCTTY